MSKSTTGSHQLSSGRAIPTRNVVLTDPSQLPHDYGTTPGGTMFSTTPGGKHWKKSFTVFIVHSMQDMRWLFLMTVPILLMLRQISLSTFFLTEINMADVPCDICFGFYKITQLNKEYPTGLPLTQQLIANTWNRMLSVGGYERLQTLRSLSCFVLISALCGWECPKTSTTSITVFPQGQSPVEHVLVCF